MRPGSGADEAISASVTAAIKIGRGVAAARSACCRYAGEVKPDHSGSALGHPKRDGTRNGKPGLGVPGDRDSVGPRRERHIVLRGACHWLTRAIGDPPAGSRPTRHFAAPLLMRCVQSRTTEPHSKWERPVAPAGRACRRSAVVARSTRAYTATTPPRHRRPRGATSPALAQVDVHVLDLRVRLEGVHAVLAAHSGHLVPTERRFRVDHLIAVDGQ